MRFLDEFRDAKLARGLIEEIKRTTTRPQAGKMGASA